MERKVTLKQKPHEDYEQFSDVLSIQWWKVDDDLDW